MPSRIERRLGLPPLLLLAALTGCAQWPGTEPPGTPASSPATSPAPAPTAAPAVAVAPTPAATTPGDAAAGPEPTTRLMALQERLRGLSAAELAREAAAREPPADAATSVEMALMWLQLRATGVSAGNPASGELARAQALLEPVARQPSAWQSAAKLLLVRVAEQRRLEDQVAQLQQQLREQQRRNEQLAAQIDALRAIERSLGGTRAPSPAPATPR